jgi:hypothetical protein
MVSGVTFAALQSQESVLAGNSIQTATANLQLSSDNQNYSNSLNGYVFNNLIPGGSPSPTIGFPIYLKNAGTSNLAVKLSISRPITNPENVDLSKVHLILGPYSGGVGQRIALQDLISSASTGGVVLTNNAVTRMLPGQSAGFSMQVVMDADAFAGPGATLSGIDFSFSANSVN